uniref:Uncharacterized protein n=1 Tax=Onchocerca volvulus TaxID=6282 RepID=A0A8R1Y3W4_ONCVO
MEYPRLRDARGGGVRETFLGGGLFEFTDLRDTGDLPREVLRPREVDRLSLYREPLRLRVEERRRRGERERERVRELKNITYRKGQPETQLCCPITTTTTRTTTTTTTAAVNCYMKQQLSQPIFP